MLRRSDRGSRRYPEQDPGRDTVSTGLGTGEMTMVNDNVTYQVWQTSVFLIESHGGGGGEECKQIDPDIQPIGSSCEAVKLSALYLYHVFTRPVPNVN